MDSFFFFKFSFVYFEEEVSDSPFDYFSRPIVRAVTKGEKLKKETEERGIRSWDNRYVESVRTRK